MNRIIIKGLLLLTVTTFACCNQKKSDNETKANFELIRAQRKDSIRNSVIKEKQAELQKAVGSDSSKSELAIKKPEKPIDESKKYNNLLNQYEKAANQFIKLAELLFIEGVWDDASNNQDEMYKAYDRSEKLHDQLMKVFNQLNLEQRSKIKKLENKVNSLSGYIMG